MTPTPPAALPILMYHSVGTSCADAYRRWMVTPDEFDNHCQALKDLGYRLVTVSQLVALTRNGLASPDKIAALSFDDGLADFLHGAVPVLAKHNIPATLYVTTGHVGGRSAWLSPLGEGDRAMLTWAQLRALQGAGIELGAHSVTHPELDAIPLAQARSEIFDSKAVLEDSTGVQVTSFAYPHGYSSTKVRALVAQAGFSNACRVRHALSSVGDDLLAQARLIMTSAIAPDEMATLLDGHSVPVAPPVERLLGTGWRMARRLRRRMAPRTQPASVPRSIAAV